MQAFDLRPATQADHDAIADIWHSSASLPGVGPAVMPTRNQLRESLDLEFASGWEVTVAVFEDDLLGFAAIKRKQAVLDQLFVRPSSLGSGVGRALLKHAKAVMPDGFTLYTRPANIRARRFYEKAGLIFLREGAHPEIGDPVVYYGWQMR